MRNKIVLVLLVVCLIIVYQARSIADLPEETEEFETAVEHTENQDVLVNGTIEDVSKLDELKPTLRVEHDVEEEPVIINSSVTFPQSYNGYSTDMIDFEMKEDYELDVVDWLDEDRLLIVLSGPELENSSLRPREIYVMNIVDSSRAMIYEGEHDGCFELRTISEENFGLQCQDSYLIFEQDSFELLNKISFPEVAGQIDASYDAKEVVYFERFIVEEEYDDFFDCQGKYYHRLLLTDLEDNSTIMLEDFIEHFSIMGLPIWSSKNELLTIWELDGLRVMVDDFRNDQHKSYELDTYTYEFIYQYWFPDGEKLLVHNPLMLFGQGEDQLYVINTTNDDIELHEFEEHIQIKDLYNSLILYGDLGQQEHMCTVYDYSNEQRNDLTNLFRDIVDASFSPSGESVALIGVLMETKNLQRSIFVITREVDNPGN
jgi:hypothetical protein